MTNCSTTSTTASKVSNGFWSYQITLGQISKHIVTGQSNMYAVVVHLRPPPIFSFGITGLVSMTLFASTCIPVSNVNATIRFYNCTAAAAFLSGQPFWLRRNQYLWPTSLHHCMQPVDCPPKTSHPHIELSFLISTTLAY